MLMLLLLKSDARLIEKKDLAIDLFRRTVETTLARRDSDNANDGEELMSMVCCCSLYRSKKSGFSGGV